MKSRTATRTMASTASNMSEEFFLASAPEDWGDTVTVYFSQNATVQEIKDLVKGIGANGYKGEGGLEISEVSYNNGAVETLYRVNGGILNRNEFLKRAHKNSNVLAVTTSQEDNDARTSTEKVWLRRGGFKTHQFYEVEQGLSEGIIGDTTVTVYHPRGF